MKKDGRQLRREMPEALEARLLHVIGSPSQRRSPFSRSSEQTSIQRTVTY
jgi:hypothetical protein